MNKEEIQEYLNRVEKLELKLDGEDKETLQWLIYGYNQCAKLLNETEQDVQKYKEVIDKVINIAYEYGQIDGAHHKTWVIDQMIRELLRTEYDKFIKEYEEDGEYTWDIGIAP